jgi:ATP-dependent helicase HrpA
LQREIGHAQPDVSAALHRSWDFGQLPPSRMLQHGELEVLVYPALVDKVEGVALQNCDRPEDASRLTRLGLARLYMLASAQQVKTLKKEFLRGNQLNLQLGQLGDRESLLQDYLLAIFVHQFVAQRPLPVDRGEFAAVLQAQAGGLFAVANEYQQIIGQIVALHHDIRSALARLEPEVWAYAIDDIQQQLRALLGDHFLRQVAFAQLSQYPRLLRGIVSRLQKLQGHQQKDFKATADIRRHMQRLWPADGDDPDLLAHPQLAEYRWLLEEYRVSLFAQDIGARKPVSAKRLDRLWQQWQQHREQP